MFENLSSTLDGIGLSFAEGKLHLIIDSSYLSGNPFFIFHLTKVLKDHNIIFVTVENTLSHYVNICNKIGIHLKKFVDSGSIKVIDLIKASTSSILSSDESLDHHSSFLDSHFEFDIKKLYIAIEESKKDFAPSSDKPVSLFIDNVSLLMCMGVSMENIDTLIHYCLNSLSNKDSILVTTCSVNGEVDIPSLYLANRLRHRCSTVMQVNSLVTGSTKHIHGELLFSIHEGVQLFTGCTKIQKFHFKYEERDVKLFAPGLSKGVL